MVHTVSVLIDGANVEVLLHGHSVAGQVLTAQEEEPPDEGPSPIAPEGKEIIWGGGAFLLLLIAFRLFLVPKVKKGMQERYGKVRSELEQAESIRDAARAEVSQYEAQLASVRGEVTARIDAARQVLERERADRLAEANEAIAARRSAAATESETARHAARGSVEDAAVAVAVRIVELSTGRRPDEAAVRNAVTELTTAGAAS
jgi:F-type H+-transporting ATPase subunit b